MSNKVKIIDPHSTKKNNGFFLEQDGEFLKVTKEQKDGTHTMRAYLFDKDKVEDLRRQAFELIEDTAREGVVNKLKKALNL